jgi:hypothetical protein
MYRPDTAGERVRVRSEGTGEYTGQTGQYGEHFEIKLDSGETSWFHKEDIEQLNGGQ